MELTLISSGEILFGGRYVSETKKRKAVSVTRSDTYDYLLTLVPLSDEGRKTARYIYQGTESLWDNTIDLLFGHSAEVAKQLKRGSRIDLVTRLTFTPFKTGRLNIDTGLVNPEDTKLDIFEVLYELQENLPQDSMEFILSIKGFESDGEGKTRLDCNEKGLKLMKNERGAACLEMTDIHYVDDIWWKQWSGRRLTFGGRLSVNVKFNIAAVTELYKRHLSRGTSSKTEGPADLVILVGGNKDKKKGIKCHKSMLSEMSPVFAAMFQTDMLEAKEGTLEIVDFSEAAIRALIQYAYQRNVDDALKSSEMTLELLEVAYKYQMKDLMDVLLHIIWCMPFKWFSVGLGFKLFFFAKNAGEELAEAEKKGWVVLKWYAEKYPEQLIESLESVHLVENPRAVMELVVLLFNQVK